MNFTLGITHGKESTSCEKLTIPNNDMFLFLLKKYIIKEIHKSLNVVHGTAQFPILSIWKGRPVLIIEFRS